MRMLRTCFSTVPSVTHSRRAIPTFERPSVISAVHGRHPDVDHHEIGLEGADERQELIRVPRLSQDFEPYSFEQAPQPFSEKHVVVGKHDTFGVTLALLRLILGGSHPRVRE